MSSYVCDHKRHPDRERKPNQCVKCGMSLPDVEPNGPVAVRSRDWEEIFLTGAARQGALDPAGWVQEVRDRIDNAEREYGQSWTTRPLREMIQEVDEEGLDLGGWPTLIGQRLYPVEGLDSDRLELALDLLQRIASLGAQERLLKLQLQDVLGLE